MTTKAAKITFVLARVTCAACDEPLESPVSGSYDWAGEDFSRVLAGQKSKTLACTSCGAKVLVTDVSKLR